MKRILKTMLFVLTLMISMISCNKEELFVEELIEVVDEKDPTDTEDTEEEEDIKDASLPCDFTLDNVESNSTVIINCILDLDGKTVNLPANVTIEYEGGDIINGTINFSEGNVIDGNLLNSTLTIGGTKPQLKDPVFEFIPSRWGIVEGVTTSEIAQRNNDILEGIMFAVKEMGITTFTIDKMDAYFEISKVTSTTTNQNFYNSIESINIPSDFHLKMTNNTIMRVYPNDRSDGGVLLCFREVSNSKVSGGILYGDRDEHDYSTSAPGEGGNHLLLVHGANNIEIDGVTLTMGSAGGLAIYSLNFTFQSNYIPSHSIVVKNCLFDKNRRMSTAITDGYNILLENNTYVDTGLDREKSDGGVVGYAINIEAVRAKDSNGEFIFYEKAYDIEIRNNEERGSRVGAITVSVGENVTIDNNTLESKIAWTYTSNTKIQNNKITATSYTSSFPGISVEGSGETVFNNEISGNTITGFSTGISAYHGNLKVFENKIDNCEIGIQLKEITNTFIYDNIIESTASFSRGVQLHLTNANDVNIYENTIDVNSNHIYFNNLNLDEGEEDNMVYVYDNELLNDAAANIFASAVGVEFKNNNSSSRVQISDATNIIVNSNTINSTNGHTVSVKSNSNGISVEDNTLKNSTGNANYQCVFIDAESVVTNEIDFDSDGNTCSN